MKPSQALERQILEHVESLPGVTSASIGSRLAVHDWGGGVPIVVPGRAVRGERDDLPERDVSETGDPGEDHHPRA